MAGAMRKMAVYLGLVEDDGYDGRGFDPDDDFEPELDPEPERDHRRREPSHQPHGTHQPQRDEEVRVVHPPAPREPVSRSASLPRNRHARRGSRPWHPSHKNAPAWRRTHR